MQGELHKSGDALEVRLLGVNGVGYDRGNKMICEGRSIPWLQDKVDVNAWRLWQVAYRDVIILDAENHVVGVYNLTQHDLGNPDNYAELQQLLVQAASGAGWPSP
jgi:hypothetical protein